MHAKGRTNVEPIDSLNLWNFLRVQDRVGDAAVRRSKIESKHKPALATVKDLTSRHVAEEGEEATVEGGDIYISRGLNGLSERWSCMCVDCVNQTLRKMGAWPYNDPARLLWGRQLLQSVKTVDFENEEALHAL